jgi:tetratricopeptide (TPR) repeat protein
MQTASDPNPAPLLALENGLKRRFLLALLLIVFAFAVFQRVPTFDFVDWDDTTNVFENPYYLPGAPEGLGRFWRAGYNELYMPVTYTFWGLCARLAFQTEPLLRQSGGITTFAPGVFHTANLLIHLVNILLVFALVRRLLLRMPDIQDGLLTDCAAAAGALLFALHPLQVESVAWVTGTNNTLGAVFALLAVHAYLFGAEGSKRQAGWMGLATVAYGLALLSKATAVALPLVVLALEVGLVRRPVRQYAPVLLLWGAMAAACALINRQFSPASEGVYLPVWGRPFIVGDALAFYLGKLLLPYHLCIVYDRAPRQILSSWWGYATWLVPALLAFALWRTRQRVYGLAAVLFVAAALPMLGVVPFYSHHRSTVGDRYVYLSMIGPALALAYLLVRWRRVGAYAAAGAALLIGGVLSYRQAELWRTTQSLMTYTLERSPDSWIAYCTLGVVRSRAGDLAGASEMYERSLEHGGRNEIVEFDLGTVLLRQGRAGEAETVLRHLVAWKPENIDARRNLGVSLLRQGKNREAIAELADAVSRAPADPYVRNQLGEALRAAGQEEAAAAQFREAIRQKPDFEAAYKNLGLALPATAIR